MMKHSSMFNECERFLKRVLKDKGLFSKGAVIAYLITGGIGFVAPVLLGDSVYGATYKWVKIQTDTGRTFGDGEQDGETNSVILAPTSGANSGALAVSDTYTIYPGLFNRKARNSVILGYGAYANALSTETTPGSFTAIGALSHAYGGQGTAVGSGTIAGIQATAIGNDVYATGDSSIAIGNDDIATKYRDQLSLETMKSVYGAGPGQGLFASKEFQSSDGSFKKQLSVLDWNRFSGSYLTGDKLIYNPTISRGIGSIAIGSRSIAAKDGSTAIGTLAYAFAEGSTAMGLRAFTSTDAVGAVAIGEQSRSFAKGSLAVGNRNESTSLGSMSYGYNAKAVGEGSLAFGYNVLANASITNTIVGAGDTKPPTNVYRQALMDNTQGFNYEQLKYIRLYDASLKEYAEILNKPITDTYTAEAKQRDIDHYSKNVTDSKAEYDKVIKAFTNSGANAAGKGGRNLEDVNNLDLVNKADTTDKSGNTVTAVGTVINDIVGKTTNAADNTLKVSLVEDVKAGKYLTTTDKNADGTESKKEIYKLKANGKNAIAIGYYTAASGDSSIAQGAGSIVEGSSGIGIGSLSYVSGEAKNGIAMGVGSQVRNANSIAIGTQAAVYGAKGIGMGPGARVIGDESMAIGYGSFVKTKASTALGVGTTIEYGANESMALGTKAYVGIGNIATLSIGNNARVEENSVNSASIGASSKIGKQSSNSVVLGTSSTIGDLATNSVVLGANATISNNSSNSMALGAGAKITDGAKSSIALGEGSSVSESNSLAFGRKSSVSGESSIAIGRNALVKTDSSIALGRSATADYKNSVALGYRSTTFYYGDEKTRQAGTSSTASGTYKHGLDIAPYLPDSAGKGIKEKLDHLNTAAAGYISVGGWDVTKNEDGSANADGAGATLRGLRRIVNVAPGALDTDAVTVAQLREWTDKSSHFLSLAGADSKSATDFADETAPDGSTTVHSNFNNDGASGLHALALGVYAKGAGAGSISIGRSSFGQGANSTTIGSYAWGRGTDATVVGTHAYGYGENSVTMGTHAVTDADYGISIGNRSRVFSEGGNGNAGIAIGNKATANYWNAMALGSESKVRGFHSTALGAYARIGVPETLDDTGLAMNAFGSDGKIRNKKGQVIYERVLQADGLTSDANGMTTVKEYEPGTTTVKRTFQIQEVSKVDNALAFGNSATVENEKVQYTENGVKKEKTVASNGSIAIGTSASVKGSQNSIALGLNSKVVYTDTKTKSTAAFTGDENNDPGNGVLSLGNSSGVTRRIIHVAGGANDDDAVNVKQLKAAVKYYKTNTSDTTNRTVNGIADVSANYNGEGATGTASVTLGSYTKASGDYSTAIGRDVITSGRTAVGVGTNVSAFGDSSVVLGNEAIAGYTKIDNSKTVPVGATEGVAIGKGAKVESSYTVAIGGNAQVVRDTTVATDIKDAESSIAIGASAKVTGAKYSVALGLNSKVTYNDTKSKTTAAFSNEENNDPTNGVVSIGDSAGLKRRLINVAGGANDYDAVNVKQLKEAIKTAGTSSKYMSVKSNKEDEIDIDGVTGKVKSNVNNDGASGTNSMAFGVYSKATDENALAMGTKTVAAQANTVAIGSDVLSDHARGIAVGYKVKAKESDTFAAGSEVTVSGYGSVGIGKKVTTSANDAVSIGSTATTSANNGISIGSAVTTSGANSTAIGATVTTSGSNSFGAGSNVAVTKNYAVGLGFQVTASGDNAIAIGSSGQSGTNVQATADDAIAVGTRAKGTASAAVAVGRFATAQGANAVALGNGTNAYNDQDIAMGLNSHAQNGDSLAIGSVAKSTGENSIAIGSHATVDLPEDTTKDAGTDARQAPRKSANSIAIGRYATTNSKDSIALGTEATVGTNTSQAHNSVAIGKNANVSAGQGSVALGWNSMVTDADVKYHPTTAGKTKANPYLLNDDDTMKDADNGVVAVGRKRTSNDGSSLARRIVGVAGGYNDYDAVNVKQLKAAAWGLQVQNGTSTKDVTPVGTGDLRKITLKAGSNVTLDNNNGVVTINASGGLNSITSSNNDVLGVSTTAGAVTLTPKVATTITGTGDDANKLVTSGVVNTAIGNIPITSFKADAGGATANTEGTFTPTADKKEINITGAGKDGTEKQTWTQGTKRFYSDNIGTHLNSDGRVLVGLNDELSVKNITTYKYGADGKRTTNAGASLTTDGLAGNGTDALTISNGDYAKITVNKGTSATDKGSIDVNGSKITGLADGTIGAGSTDAVTGGQLYSKLAEKANASDLAGKLNKTAELHVRKGDYTVGTNGEVSLIQEDADGTEKTDKAFTIKNIATKDSVDTLTGKVNTNTTNIANLTTTVGKAITFKDNDGQGVAKKLGEALSITGEGTVPTGTNTAANNIKTTKLADGSGLQIGLADKLTNMKGITGTDGFTISSGGTGTGTDIATMTFNPKKTTGGTTTEANISVNKVKLTGLKDAELSAASTDAVTGKQLYATNTNVTNLTTKVTNNTNNITNLMNTVNANTNLGYKADGETTAKKVAVGTGLTFKPGTGTVGATGAGASTTNAETVKKGIAISTEDNGVVNIGLDADTRTAIDNAANKDLGNLSDTGKGEVKKLANEAVKFGDGKNTKVNSSTASNVTTYKIDAYDTKLTGTTEVTVGAGDTADTNNVRNYTIGLSQATKETLAKVATLETAIGKNGADGRDGKPGITTGTTAAGMGKDGLTGADGLNGKDLTTKVNALRNGEAGTVVYTDDQGNRVVKANDGKWYDSRVVDETGALKATADIPAGVSKAEVTTPQARLVNPDGTTVAGAGNKAVTKLSNIADGTIAANSHDAVTGGQLHTVKQDVATNTQNITSLTNKVNTNTTDINTLKTNVDKSITFSADTGTAATRKLGSTLAVKGGDNFTPAATDKNIRVTSDNTTGLTVHLADTLTKMKGISGTGTSDFVIKNGDNAVITVKAPTGTDTKGTVDFGGTKLTNLGNGTIAAGSTDAVTGDQLNSKLAEKANVSDLTGKVDKTAERHINSGSFNANTGTITLNMVDGTGASKADENVSITGIPTELGYKANGETTTNKVALGTGLTFKAGTGTIAPTGLAAGAASTTASTDNVVTKTGIKITTEENGVVNIGLDEATRKAIDNAANKDLGNLSDTGKNVIKTLANEAVKLGDGKNTKVNSTTTNNVTTYTVDAYDTHVAGTTDEIEVTPAAVGTDNVRNYTIGLSQATKDTLAKVSTLETAIGKNGADGRDGKSGTGTGAGMGKDGLTGSDGLNGKDLTSKVNALRNGEAGTVVYTDDQGNRVVKANDGKWYNAKAVDDKGALKEADQLPAGVTATAVDHPQARLVNPDGTTTIAANTTGTKLTNIADGTIAAGSHDAVTGGQLHTAASKIAEALGGGATVGTDGTVTKPTYTITTDGATAGTETADNVGTAITKLDARINTLKGNPLTFSADTGTAATRKLGETLAVKGGTNFTPVTTGTGTTPKGTNIQVKSNATDGLSVHLADTLTDMKGITGTGTSDLVIKNGDTTITVKPSKPAEGANPAVPSTVDFGGAKLTNVAKATDNGDVTNKEYVDEAISKVNKAVSGNATLNFAGNVTKDATNADTDKVGLALSTGVLKVQGDKTANDIVTTAKGDTITIGLSQATKDTLAKVSTLETAIGKNGADGRDGKPGTGTAAGMGKDGVTGKDGLNGTDLTTKVNALRNGEAGTVVYTDESGNRVVRASDGKFYNANEVKADGSVKNKVENGGKEPTEVTTIQARLVNPDGTTVPKAGAVNGAATTKLSNIAEGAITSTSNDAVTGRQLHAAETKIAEALGGGAAVGTDGTVTKPTYTITKDGATTGTETADNVGTAITKLDTRINTLKGNPLTFSADTGTAATRKLGETLAVKGGDNFTSGTAGKNIQVQSNAADGLTVHLADTLTNMKGISGTGTNDLVIKNGDYTTITVKPGTAAPAGGTATPGTVDFGGSKLTHVGEATGNDDVTNKKYVDDKVASLNLGYKAESEAAKSVAVTTGLTFKAGTGTIAPTGLAAGATSTTASTDNVVTKTGIKITTEENGIVNIGLDEATRKVIDNAAKLGDTAVDGRDGKPGTGTDAGMGAQGPTGSDGLNGTDLTTKVNALRNGEAGTVVYTDEAGKRVVRATDGKFYHTDDVDEHGVKKGTATEVTSVQARLVNPDGTTAPDASDVNKKALTKLSNIAEGAITATSNDAVTGRQLHVAKQELATALGGGAAVNTDGTLKAPTYKITNDGATTSHSVNNVGAAVEKLDARITTARNYTDTTVGTAKTALTTAGMNFKGDDTTNSVHRDLGTELTIKGGANFNPTAASTTADAGTNIRVEKDTTKNANGLVVKLADTLTNMKGISGTGNGDFIIKNGETKITINQGTPATGGGTATPGTVDFGGSKLTNLGAGTIGAGSTDAVTGGQLNTKLAEKANTDLDNLTTAGTNKVKELAQGAVKVAAGKNAMVTADNSTANATTYVVDANDTTVSAASSEIVVDGGTLGADRVRKYTVGLSQDVKDKLNNLGKIGNTVADGRDGKTANGSGTTAGDHGLTGKDGLNGKDLTTKVNALRNGEAGTVVYTDKDGNRLVKTNDGKWYPATAVDDNGTLKSVPTGGTAPVEVKAKDVVASLVSPDGTTTNATTVLNNVGSALASIQKDTATKAEDTNYLDKLAKATEGTSKVANSVVNVTDLKKTADAIIDKGLTFKGNDGTDIPKALGSTLSIVGEGDYGTPAVTPATAAKNIFTKHVTENNVTRLEIGLVKDLVGITSIANETDTTKPITKVDIGNDGITVTNTQPVPTGAAAGTQPVVTKTTIGKEGVKVGDTVTLDKAGISGNGTNPLTITNGTNTKITVSPSTTTDTKGTVDFGGARITNIADPTTGTDAVNKAYVDGKIGNVADIGYKANAETTTKKVAVGTGLHFMSGTGTVAPANLPAGTVSPTASTDTKEAKKGIVISTDAGGIVNIGLDADTRKVIDNAAKLGDTFVDGRDGKPGTGANAGMGRDGLTGADGMNGKDLTSKVNALRNGEAGTVVYTNAAGERLVKADDGKFYKADDVDEHGKVKTPAAGGTAPVGLTADKVIASLVSPDGTTAPKATDTAKKAMTKLSNIAEGAITSTSNDVVTGRQIHAAKKELADALGGNAAVGTDGTWTKPTYTITNDSGTTNHTVHSVGEAVTKLDTRITDARSYTDTTVGAAKAALTADGMDFKGDDGNKVHRNLKEELTIKGGANFTPTGTTPATGAGVNIRVEKDSTAGANGLTVKLADTLTGMNGITAKSAATGLKLSNGGDPTAAANATGKNEVTINEAGTTFTNAQPADPAVASSKATTSTVTLGKDGTAEFKHETAGTMDNKVTIDSKTGTVTAGKDADKQVTINGTDGTITTGNTVVGSNIITMVDGTKAATHTADTTTFVNGGKEATHSASGSTFTDGTNTTITNANGITITPSDVGGNPVSLTTAGLNNGGNRITHVAAPTADDDAVNKQYVDDRGTLRYAADSTVDEHNAAVTNHTVNLLDGTLAVNGTADKVVTKATKDGITIDLADAVNKKLAQLDAKNSDGRDGKLGSEAGAIASAGVTKADGLNETTTTYKVNALRNGEAGSVVYTDADGNRLVKATDGKFYKATDVDANGNVKAPATGGTAPVGLTADKVIASLVSPDGTTAPDASDANKKAMTKLSNIAEGAITSTSNDAVTGRQIHAAKKELATVLGGNASITDAGVWTGPTFKVTKDDNSGTKEDVHTVDDAITKLDTRINTTNTNLENAKNDLIDKGLDFYGNDAAEATGKVHRKLGEKLTLEGAGNFTRGATESNNIKVERKATADGFDIKLAENLANMKEIAGNGTNDLVIKNGTNKITITAGKAATGTTPADPGTVDFGDAKVTVKNLDASITYRANGATDADAKTVKLQQGLDFVAGTGTIGNATTGTDAETTKKGIAITTGENGKVYFGLDADTRKTIDNAAKIGNTASDGRDGKTADGTGVAAGDKGATGKDGLNGKDLTNKVNALRNGEAGSVVYTDADGNRLVKANDGKYYKANEVKDDGTVKTAAELGVPDEPKAVDKPQARLVNPDGTTTPNATDVNKKAMTKLSNIAEGAITSTSNDAVTGRQIYDERINAGLIYIGQDGKQLFKQADGTFKQLDGTNYTGATNTVYMKVNGTDSMLVTNVKSAVAGISNSATVKDYVDKLDAAVTNADKDRNATSAVNVSDLKETAHAIIDKGLTFQGNDGTAISKTLGSTLDIVGEGAAATTTATDNIRTKANNGKLEIGLVKDLKHIDSITAGSPTAGLILSNGGNPAATTGATGKNTVAITDGATTFTNTQPADPAVTDSKPTTSTVIFDKNGTASFEHTTDGTTDNKVTIDSKTGTITAGKETDKQVVINGTDGTIKTGNTTVDGTSVSVKDGDKTSTMNADGVTVENGDDKTKVGSKGVSISDGTNAAVHSATESKFVADGKEASYSANGVHVTDGADKSVDITSDGTTIANGTVTTTTKAGESEYVNGNKVTTVNTDGVNVTDGTNTANYTASGITLSPSASGAGTVSLTTAGLNNGGNVIANVAAGTVDTDAVNLKQLKAGKTTFSVNDKDGTTTNHNLVLTTTKDATDGHTHYDVKLADKVTLGKDANAVTVDGTNGSITAGKDGNAVTVDGTKASITAGKDDKAVTVDGTKASITAGKDDKAVTVDGTKASITAGKDDKAVTVDGTKASITAGKDDKAVTVDGTKASITAGKDDKAVTVDGTKASITAGKDDKAVTVDGTKASITAGKDDKAVTVDGTKATLVVGGTGATTDSANKVTINGTDGTIKTGKTEVSGSAVSITDATNATKKTTVDATGTTVTDGVANGKKVVTTAESVTVTDGTTKTTTKAGETKYESNGKDLTVKTEGITVTDGNNTGSINAMNSTFTNATNGTQVGATLIRVNGAKAADGSVTTNGIAIGHHADVVTSVATATKETGNFITGLDNKTWDPKTNGIVSGRAATEDQLKVVDDKVNKGRVFSADTLDANKKPVEAMVGLGDTLSIVGGADMKALTDNNIGVELKAAETKDGVTTPATMTVKLAKNVKMGDGSTTYNTYLAEYERNADGSLKLEYDRNPDGTVNKNSAHSIVAKNADGSTKYQTDAEGNKIAVRTVTHNGDATYYTLHEVDKKGHLMTDAKGNPLTNVETGIGANGIEIASGPQHNKPSVTLTSNGLNNGGNRITNVAPGVEATDAVNVGQVNSITTVLDRRINQTGAKAAAMAAMKPLMYDPLKKSQIMAGFGAQKGAQALALGVAHYFNEDVMVNMGLSVGAGDNMMNAGVTYRFGGDDSMIPERYKGGPISSIYVMQDEISALKAENEQVKSENAQIKADNSQVRADNERMKASYEKIMEDNAQMKQDNEEMKAQIKMLMAHMGIK